MSYKSQHEICQLLSKGYFAQAKEKISLQHQDINQTDEHRRTPLMICSLIDDSIWSVSLSRYLIQFGADLEKKDECSLNVFHYACILEKVDLLKVLLQSVDFDINKGDRYGNSPLMYAIVANNVDMLNLLLDYYKRYKITVDKPNLDGINPVIQACLCENVELTKELLELGANKNFADKTGKTVNQYHKELLTKVELMSQVTENRRQSRTVRFDDIEKWRELQEQAITLKTDAQKIKENIDLNTDRMNQIKLKLRKIRRNKIDLFYKSKWLSENGLGENGHLIRPKSTISIVRTPDQSYGWYGLLGPLYISLEQQHSKSFRIFSRLETSSTSRDSISIPNERVKSRQRRYSRSYGSQSRRGSICKISEEGSECSFNSKSKKRIDALATPKLVSRNSSRSFD